MIKAVCENIQVIEAKRLKIEGIHISKVVIQ